MGFSLKRMIFELEEIAGRNDMPAEVRQEFLTKLAWWKDYAKTCGKLL